MVQGLLLPHSEISGVSVADMMAVAVPVPPVKRSTPSGPQSTSYSATSRATIGDAHADRHHVNGGANCVRIQTLVDELGRSAVDPGDFARDARRACGSIDSKKNIDPTSGAPMRFACPGIPSRTSPTCGEHSRKSRHFRSGCRAAGGCCPAGTILDTARARRAPSRSSGSGPPCVRQPPWGNDREGLYVSYAPAADPGEMTCRPRVAKPPRVRGVERLAIFRVRTSCRDFHLGSCGGPYQAATLIP
jgi:hypothetical protein